MSDKENRLNSALSFMTHKALMLSEDLWAIDIGMFDCSVMVVLKSSSSGEEQWIYWILTGGSQQTTAKCFWSYSVPGLFM